MIEIKNKLKEYNNFQECIIEDIVFSDFGTSVSIFFDYIWINEKELRKNLDEKHIVTLKFFLVNKFLMENELSKVLVDSPNSMNWGINEISKINIVESANKIFYTVEIVWESKRKIVLEFKEFILS
jgi:hypothetical protein